MKRYKDKVVKFPAWFPTVPNSAMLICCMVHWPVERKAVRKLSMINKTMATLTLRQRLDERSDKKTNSTECNSPFPGN